MYIRLLTIPLGQRPDWEAAQAELERQIANGSRLDPHTVNRLRSAIEDPDAWELLAFPFCGQACYLAFGNDYDPSPGLEIFFATGDDTGIAHKAGLKGVATDMASDIGPDGLSSPPVWMTSEIVPASSAVSSRRAGVAAGAVDQKC